ncbi:hypothetical protein M0802_008119 [Mischocyttarus mexicanus]|nr:hypothetical protein M0802_008119 [Mischocyttarus mexicanus]
MLDPNIDSYHIRWYQNVFGSLIEERTNRRDLELKLTESNAKYSPRFCFSKSRKNRLSYTTTKLFRCDPTSAGVTLHAMSPRHLVVPESNCLSPNVTSSLDLTADPPAT